MACYFLLILFFGSCIISFLVLRSLCGMLWRLWLPIVESIHQSSVYLLSSFESNFDQVGLLRARIKRLASGQVWILGVLIVSGFTVAGFLWTSLSATHF